MFAWQVGNPPILNASGFTSNEFFDSIFLPSGPDPLWFPTGYVFSSTNKTPNIVFPFNGYGNYCVNCHASAINESTFSSIENIPSPKRYNPELFANSTLFPSPFIQALAETYGQAKFDPYYTDPSLTGADVIEYKIPLDKETPSRVHDVQVTLYNQSIPPFYLQERFADANVGSANKTEIERLYYLTSHLNVDDVIDENGNRVVKDWKLYITSETRNLQ